MEDFKDIAKKISTGRKESGLTQAELAKILFVSPQAVGKWERSESLPDVFMLAKIAKAFNQTPNCILDPATCTCGDCKWCCITCKH